MTASVLLGVCNIHGVCIGLDLIYSTLFRYVSCGNSGGSSVRQWWFCLVVLCGAQCGNQCGTFMYCFYVTLDPLQLPLRHNHVTR